MSDMNNERQRLSRQMQQDLSELKFSAAMRESVLARIRAEAAARPFGADDMTSTETAPLTRAMLERDWQADAARPPLRAVPPGGADPSRQPADRRRSAGRPFWRRTGLWLTGGSVAAAAAVLAIVLTGPFSTPGLPEQRLAGAPEMAGNEEMFTTMSLGASDAEAAGADVMLTATAAEPEGDAAGAAAAADPPPAGGAADAEDGSADLKHDVPDGDAPDGSNTPSVPADVTDPRPGVGVAAQPGSQPNGDSGAASQAASHEGSQAGVESSGSSADGEEPSPTAPERATLRELDREAEVVVVAQVRRWKGHELTLTPMFALKGTVPDKDLTVTMPSVDSSLSESEIVIAFLRQADATPSLPVGKKPGNNGKGPGAVRWRLVGGMAGIFRANVDGFEPVDGAIDVDEVRDQVR